MRDEHGFTLLETVIAVGVIFSALTVLAYAATAGFGYQSLARERQAANGIADKIMEDVRGLAYAKIQAGMAASELAGDPNLVKNCSGDSAGTYRFLSCTAGSTPGSGERAIQNGQPNTPPLVPHSGTISAGYPTSYTYRTYVTNNCPTASSPGCTAATPYRITVMVSWGGGAIMTRSVTTQSLFWSPSGCVSSNTHPYAAPCQPFFFGQAQVPQGAITISGQVEGLDLKEADLLTGGVESDAQQEQFGASQASYSQAGVVIADNGGGRQTAGGVPAVTAASDTDPSGTVPSYGSSTMVSGAGGSVSLSQGQTSLTITAPSGDAATANAATTANATQPCPPWTPMELDGTLCAGSQIQQGGSLTATGVFTQLYKNVQLGTASLATIGAAANDPNRTSVDRQLVSGLDGTMVSAVTRRLGTVSVAGLPSGIPGPAGWSGYLVTLTGYQDAAKAAVGPGATAPTGSVTAGTISYWNGSGYTTAMATQTVTPASVTASTTINGHPVEVDITSTPLVGATFTPTSTALSGSPAALGDADANMSTPLTGTITYVIKVDAGTPDEETLARLSIRVDLGTMVARGVYQRTPTAG